MNRTLQKFFATLTIMGMLVVGAMGQTKEVPAKAEKPAKTEKVSKSTEGIEDKKAASPKAETLPENIQKAQAALKTKGLFKGEASGKMDPDTREAIKAYQTQEGLKPTGRLNKDTRVKLGVEAGEVKSEAKKPKKSKKEKAGASESE